MDANRSFAGRDYISRKLIRNWLAAILSVVVIAFTQDHARADYLLDTGDVLEISVFGVTDFNRRTNVNVDGDVAVPFLGEVRAAGLTIGELRQEVALRLAKAGAFREPNVIVELIQHRPFYIAGDVMNPGAHPFHPSMTVRHAVALAGGYSAMRFQAENPLLLAPEIESRHNSLWVELINRQLRVLSLGAELDGSGQWDVNVLYAAPLSRSTIDELVRLEQNMLDLRMEEARMETRHLEEAVIRSEQVFAAMEKAVAEQKESLDQQEGATERAIARNSQGITTNTRVDDERRALANLRSQHMDATSRMMTAKREIEEQKRLLQQIQSERQQQLVTALRDATSELERVKFQLRATGEQLIYTGGLKAQLKNTNSGPDLTIIRRQDDGVRRIAVTEDSAMLPGDVLDVTIRPDRLIVVPGQ